MAETASQGLLSPVLSDILLFMNISLSIVLMFAFAYLWTTRHQTGEIAKLNDKIKKLSSELKALNERVQNIKIPQKVDTVPEPAPFGLDMNKRRAEAAPPAKKVVSGNQVWSEFIDDYNFLAASMLVPGQLQACQKFVDENELRLGRFGMTGNLLPVMTIEESIFWAWKIPKTQNYAIVPNPMKPCTGDFYENSGIKMIFAMDFENGIYKKYSVKVPAIFNVDANNRWILKDPGVINLFRQ